MFSHSFNLSVSVLPHFLSKSLLPSIIIALPGILFIVSSIITLHLTLEAFNKSLRFGLDSGNLGELTTNGIFHYTRNPLFLAINMQFIGIALIYTTPFFIAIALLSAISIHLFVLKEEQFMRNNYGELYNDYSRKVKRYF